MRALDDFVKDISKVDVCPNCDNQLPRVVDYYSHDGGWQVKGFEHRQWLSVHCSHCNYDWSLWKLGILGSVEHPEL